MNHLVAGSFRRVLVTAVVGITVSVLGYADDSSLVQSSQIGNVAPAPAQSKVIGTLDLRAEYMGNQGAFDTSNYFQIGYQFNPDVKVTWFQNFDSNLYNSTVGTPPGGLNAVLDQGWLRTRVSNIWKRGDLSFAYESRIYVPTLKADQDAGNITRLYNAFKLIKKVNNTVTLSAVEVLMPEIYNTDGTGGIKGSANPWFENRVYLVADFNFTSNLSLSFPILWYHTRYRDYLVGAKNAGTWGDNVYIWPELDYALNNTLTFGLAYISDNMVKSDLSGLTLSQAFQKGTLQFVVTTNL